MDRASPSIPFATQGPLFIGVGLAIILTAQLWAAIPIAAAIALIGLGATLSLSESPFNKWIVPVNWLIYASLSVLAIAAEFDMRPDMVSLGDALLAGAILALTLFRINPQSRAGHRA